MWWMTVIGVVFVLAAPVFLVAGLRQQGQRSGQVATWPKVAGRVVRDTVFSDIGASTSTIEFTTLDGRVIRAEATSSVDSGTDATGRNVPVWYDPEEPERIWAKVHTGDSSVVPTVLLSGGLAVVGLVAIVVGLH